MTFLQMQTMLADLLAGRDMFNYQGSSPSATDVAEQLNHAARFVSRQIYQFDPSISFTLTINDGDYDLFGSAFGKDILEAKRVVINGRPLRKPNGEVGLWTYQEVEDRYSQWRTASSGLPRIAFQLDRTLYLYPKPDSAYSNCFVAGQYQCGTLSGSDTSLSYDIPDELHVAVVRMAADFAADPLVAEVEAVARLQRYVSKAGYDIEEMRRRNKRLASSIGSTPGSAVPNLMWL
jgi:hypothetical protein